VEKKELDKLAKALGAEIITDPEERKKFEKKYGWPRPLLPIAKKSEDADRTMETCGNCKHWDTSGFGLRESWGSEKATSVGTCTLVARRWYPPHSDKMIALNGTEHAHWPGSELIAVITRRDFGCNQFKSYDKKSA